MALGGAEGLAAEGWTPAWTTPDAEFALARVRERVRLGGHDVPEVIVRRCYARGLWARITEVAHGA
jgi:predicted ABC-type ATPase